MRFEHLIGRRVEIIYKDGKGAITQRTATVCSVQSDQMKVFDHQKREHRTMKLDRVLAARPALGRRVS